MQDLVIKNQIFVMQDIRCCASRKYKDWTVNPFKPSVKKGHLIGRGANDMKSSIALLFLQ